MGVFDLARWPAILVLALAGASAVAFAFITLNLFAMAMANLSFIREHGLLALREGALVQLAELTGWGLVALLTYLTFKACEVNLLFRYHDWSDRRRQAREGRKGERPDDAPAPTPDDSRAERRRMFRFRRR